MTTPVNQFITFSEQLTDIGYSLKVYSAGDLKFHVTENNFKFAMTNRWGKILTQWETVRNTGWYNVPIDVTKLAIQDEFRIAVIKGTTVFYSNLLQFCNSKYGRRFEYKDRNNTYAPYYTGSAIIRLDVNEIGKSDKTDKEEYTDFNGKIVRPYNIVRKEIELEFDFMPEWMHEKIKFMLQHPILKIDDVEYLITSDYEINYDDKISYDIDYMKAKCKLAILNPIIFKN